MGWTNERLKTKVDGKDCKKNNLSQKGIMAERMGKKRSKW